MTDRSTLEQDKMLNTYMRDVARYPLLSPDEERELGQCLLQRRRGYWHAVLAYAPYTAAAVAVIAPRMQDFPELVPVFEEASVAARGARDTNRRAAADRFERAVEVLAKALAAADSECLGADLIAADLELMASACQEGLAEEGAATGGVAPVFSMDVRPPRRGSERFAAYLTKVRKASAALRIVRNRFARANLRLVVRIAHRFQRSGLTLHDRVQEGNLGLMKAVDRFDPDRGFRFSTYASWWIKHAIRRAVVNRDRVVRLPAHLQATAQKIASTQAKLRIDLKAEPTGAQIAEALGTSLEKLDSVFDALMQRSVSLEARVSEADDRSVADTLADDEAPSMDETIAASRDAVAVRSRLLSLTPIEQDILKQRFGLDGGDERTLTEIGGQYALSRERIRQLQQKALHRLRDELDAAV